MMIDPASPETLSAYIDGELAPEERRRVEAHLASSPESQRLVDELRTLSAVVGGLPRHASGRDLAAEVMDRAHRRRSASPADRGTDGHRAGFRRLLRPLVWSGVAIAAALLVMVLTDGPDELRRVATEKPETRRSDNARTGGAVTKHSSDTNTGQERLNWSDQDKAATASAGVPPEEKKPHEPRVARIEPLHRGQRGASSPAPAQVTDATATPRDDTSPDSPGTEVSGPRPASPVLVIQATLRGDADVQKVRSLVTRQGIAWKEPHRRSARTDSAPDAEGRLRTTLAPVQQQQQRHTKRSKTAGDQHVVYVEATATQVDAMLAAIENSPEQWTDVSVRQFPVEAFATGGRETWPSTDTDATRLLTEAFDAMRTRQQAYRFRGSPPTAPSQSISAPPGEDADVAKSVQRRSAQATSLPEVRRQLQQARRMQPSPANMPDWQATARILVRHAGDAKASIAPGTFHDGRSTEAFSDTPESIPRPIREAMKTRASGAPATTSGPQAAVGETEDAEQDNTPGAQHREAVGRGAFPVQVLLVIRRSAEVPSLPPPTSADP